MRIEFEKIEIFAHAGIKKLITSALRIRIGHEIPQ